jgi:ankyrin repeat protein
MKHDALLLLVFEVVIRFLRSSPLHESSYGGHLEVCKCLIAAQADVNAKDNGWYDLNSMRIFYET